MRCVGSVDWQRYNDREKRMVQNTVMLVGLLYKMCKLQLVIPAKTEGAPNRVDMDGAETAAVKDDPAKNPRKRNQDRRVSAKA